MLPSNESSLDLANEFVKFFDQKIQKIRTSLDNASVSASSVNVADKCDCSLLQFQEVSEDYVREIVMQSSKASCTLDPLPMSLFMFLVDDLLPVITKIVNKSLSSGYFPDAYKVARVKPLIKKPSLDREDMTNFRPISNLRFDSKLVERVAVRQLQTYLKDNGLQGNKQSAYREGCSTETALLRVCNDLLQTIDKGDEAVLVLLDFSAAFDTIDHHVLIARLEERYGIGDRALDWFASYLDNRKQAVAIDSMVSDPLPLDCGVPQGSVAGPIIFTLYSAPIEDVASANGIQCMTYADDTQLHISMKPSDRDVCIAKLEQCLVDIKSWTIRNKLRLNDSKTEIVHVTSRNMKTTAISGVKVGDTTVKPTSSARNLGVILDHKLCMTEHVNNVCRNATHAIRSIGRIRHYLDQVTTEKLVHAYVTSRLDNCNSLLYGLPDSEIMKLQRIQNTAARLVTRTKKYDSISAIIRGLHWLSIRQRIAFKINLLTFKALNGLAPPYLSELITPYAPSRSLRSSSQNLIKPPTRRPRTAYGQRSFMEAAHREWNNLPQHARLASSIDVFKTKLKTFLFNQ